MLKKKFSIIIQARMGSSRLPNKVLLKYKNLSILDILINRLNNSRLIDKIIIATTNKNRDIKIVNYCKKNNIKYFRGSETDVLSRYYHAAKKYKIQNIIRITSDCPLVDYRIINLMIKIFKNTNIDYLANTYPMPTNYPDGMDIEIFNFKTLKNTFYNAELPSEREHVTIYMWKSGKFKIKKITIKKNFSKYRFCIDYNSDFIFLKKIINKFKENIFNVSMLQLINFCKKNSKIIVYQQNIIRNQGWLSSLKKDKKFLEKHG
jgi:spore coat polysaccharide biosynthesis protein SpsF (cytidylyltransferase family)